MQTKWIATGMGMNNTTSPLSNENRAVFVYCVEICSDEDNENEKRRKLKKDVIEKFYEKQGKFCEKWIDIHFKR